MANWKFTDEYGSAFPMLQESLLASLQFSDHQLTGNDFTGTIDIAATGAAMETIGAFLQITLLRVSGTIRTDHAQLSIDLSTSQSPGDGITKQVTAALPLLKENIHSAWLIMKTTVSTNEADEPLDVFDIVINLSIGGHLVKLDTTIPMHGGFMVISAQPEGVGITLNDLNHLFGGGGGNNSWQSGYPSQYEKGSAGLFLLGITLDVLISLDPTKITITSVTGTIGLVGVPLLEQRLYLNPLAVWLTVSGITTDNTSVDYGLEGSLALVNYETPGNYKNPDFAFNVGMDLKNFSINGQLTNPEQKSIAQMISDFSGEKIELKTLDEMTIAQFDFAASTTKETGKISNFSFNLDIKGEFGRLKDFEIQEIKLS